MYVSVVVVLGHLYLSLIHASTRHALRGMTLGSVREDWARAHHAKWDALRKEDRGRTRGEPSPAISGAGAALRQRSQRS